MSTTTLGVDRFRPPRTRLTGQLIEPGDARWRAATRTFDLTVTQEPALVALPATDEDVVAIVAFAREHGLQVGTLPREEQHAGIDLPDRERDLERSDDAEVAAPPLAATQPAVRRR
jgi:hypothetical protein